MTQETFQQARQLDADIWRLEEDAQNCQIFIDEAGKHNYFVGCDGSDNMKVPIPKALLAEALEVVRKGIADQLTKLKQEFETL